jgi:hypothetical protein
VTVVVWGILHYFAIAILRFCDFLRIRLPPSRLAHATLTSDLASNPLYPQPNHSYCHIAVRIDCGTSTMSNNGAVAVPQVKTGSSTSTPLSNLNDFSC